MNSVNGKVLVLGASGLVGGRACQYLRKTGWHVRGASRDRGFRVPHASETVWVDWSRPDTLRRACEGIDVLVHLASPNAGQVSSRPDILAEMEKANRMLCQAMKGQAIQRAIYLSSIHVYGDRLQGSVTEDIPANPSHPYGKMHLAAENLFLDSRLPWVVLRSTNGVGWPVGVETNCWMLLANDLCRQAATNGRFRLEGNGTAQRDFLPLAEILRAFDFLLSAKPGLSGIHLLATGTTRTTRWLAEQVGRHFVEKTGNPPSGLPVAIASAKVAPRFSLDSSKLRNLGFEANGSLDQELGELVSRCLVWFRPNPATRGLGCFRVKSGR